MEPITNTTTRRNDWTGMGLGGQKLVDTETSGYALYGELMQLQTSYGNK